MKIKKIPVNSLRVGVFSEHCHQYTNMCLIYTFLFFRILMCIIFRYTLSTVSEIWYFPSDLALFRVKLSHPRLLFKNWKQIYIFVWMAQRKEEVRTPHIPVWKGSKKAEMVWKYCIILTRSFTHTAKTYNLFFFYRSWRTQIND